MQFWQDYIKRGDLERSEQHYSLALDNYRHAIALAHCELMRWPDAEQAVAAVTDSYHRLADLYRSEGQLTKARIELEKVHQLMVDLINHPQSRPALKEAALNASERTVRELNEFLEVHKDAWRGLQEKTTRRLSDLHGSFFAGSA